MGFIQPAVFSNGMPTSFYNLEHAVGQCAPNRPDDVKLVQYLLRALNADLIVDGLCGPKTQRAIRDYQTYLRGTGANVLVDSRIDRARGSGATSSISRTTYVIILLNLQVQSMNPGAYAALPSFVTLKPAGSVDPAANDYVPMPQSTQAPGRAPAGPLVIPATGGI